MKYLLYFSIIFLVITHKSFGACSLELHPAIIKISDNPDQLIIKRTNCDTKVTSVVTSFISTSSGSLDSRYLELMIQSKTKLKAIIQPRNIHVQSLHSLIKDRVSTSDIVVQKVSPLTGVKTLRASSIRDFKVHCTNCNEPGQKNIKLSFNNTKIWINTKLLIKRQALVSKASASAFSPLDLKMFEIKEIFDDGKSLLFTEVEKINFLRLARNLLPGQPLRKSDITPIDLVKLGQKTNLFYRSNGVQIKTSAKSRQAGRIGDFIELVNEKSGKKIMAKVIDFNTAVIEL